MKNSAVNVHKAPVLTPLPNSVDLLYLQSFVYRSAEHLDPCMRLKRKFLSTNNHLGRHAVTPQHACCYCRSLQTPDPFRIPTRSAIHRVTDSVGYLVWWVSASNCPVFNDRMH